MEIRDFSFVHKYFMEEKQGSLIFLVIGAVSVITAIVFFFFIKNNSSFFKGMAIPLIVLGLLELIAGYTVYSRSDKQRMEVAYKMGIETVQFTKTEELPRMQKVMSNFAIYSRLEILFFVVGLVLFFAYRDRPEKVFWYGLGLSLAIQAALLFVGDKVAEKRGSDYTAALGKLVAEVKKPQ